MTHCGRRWVMRWKKRSKMEMEEVESFRLKRGRERGKVEELDGKWE